MGTDPTNDDRLHRLAERLSPDTASEDGAAGDKLSRWLVRNHDGFALLLARLGRADWTTIAARLGEVGLRDRGGKPPTAEGVRKAWQRARKVVAQRAARGQASPVQARRDPPDVVFLTDGPAKPPEAPAPGGDGLSEIRRKLAARSGVIPGND